MADRRRRRRVKSELDESEGEELSELSDEERGVGKESELESELEKACVESEYESAEEEEASEGEQRKKKGINSKTTYPNVHLHVEGDEDDVPDIEVEAEYVEGEEVEDEEDEEGDCIEGERQEGDGEESVEPIPSQEITLDDDEDRRNPQYIPKKGSFYEHDDRLNAESEEEEIKEKDKDKKKKKLWLDEGKWQHDMFREDEQIPKSKDELLSIYGYDIRCEDGPPRARRRRRYGHGPTKYTRNWQDETAYGKIRELNIRSRGRGRDRGVGRNQRLIRGRGRIQRPELSNGNGVISENEDNINIVLEKDMQETLEKVNSETSLDLVINKEEFPALPSKDESCSVLHVEESLPEKEVNLSNCVPLVEDPLELVRTQTFENSKLSQNSVRNDVSSSQSPRGYINTGYVRRARGRTSNRGRRFSPNFVPKGPNEYYLQQKPVHANQSQGPRRNYGPRLEEKMSDAHIAESLAIDMKKLSMSKGEQQIVDAKVGKTEVKNSSKTGSSNHLGNSIPSRGGDSSSRPKRYSSLRQRSLPETSYPPTQPTIPPQYYGTTPSYQPALYVASEAMPTNTQQTGSPPLMTPAAFQGYTGPSYPENFAMRPPITSPTRIFPPVTLPTPQPVMPSTFIAPTAGLVNFAPPPPPPPAAYPQYSFPQFTSPPPPPPPVAPVVSQQQQEIYRGGVTYYNTHNQLHARALPQKRPKAAIPIVPPPEKNKKAIHPGEFVDNVVESVRETREGQPIDKEDGHDGSTLIPTHPTVEVES